MILRDGTSPFVGRKEELQEIENILMSSGSSIIEVFGPPGIGKTELVEQALSRTQFKYQQKLSYSFGSENESKPEFNIFNIIEHLAADLGVSFPHKKGYVFFDNLLNEIRIKCEKLSLLIFLDRLELLFAHIDDNPEQNYKNKIENKFYQYFQKLMNILANAPNTKVVLATAFRFNAEQDFKFTSMQLIGLDTDSAIELIKLNGITGLRYDLEWAVTDYQAHPLALTLMCENIKHLGLELIMDRFKFDNLFNDDIKLCHYWKKILLTRISNVVVNGNDKELLNLAVLFGHDFTTMDLENLSLHLEKINFLKPTSYFRLPEFKWHHPYFTAFITSPYPANSTIKNDWQINILVQQLYYPIVKKTEPELWRAAQQFLYEYYQGLPAEDVPQTDQERVWLSYAVKHGCELGKFEECWNEIVTTRMQQSGKHFIDSINNSRFIINLLWNFTSKNGWNINPDFEQSDSSYFLILLSSSLLNHGIAMEEILYLEKQAYEFNENTGDFVPLYNVSITFSDMGNLQKARDLIESRAALPGSAETDNLYKILFYVQMVNILTLMDELSEAESYYQKYKRLIKEASKEDLKPPTQAHQLVRFLGVNGNKQALIDNIKHIKADIKLLESQGNIYNSNACKSALAASYFYLEDYALANDTANELYNPKQWPSITIWTKCEILIFHAKALLKTEQLHLLPPLLEICNDYVVPYGLNLYLTDYYLIVAEFTLMENRLEEAKNCLHLSRALIDQTGYELVRSELNELELQAGLPISFKGQYHADGFKLNETTLLATLFQMVVQNPDYSELLQDLQISDVNQLITEQLESSNESSPLRSQSGAQKISSQLSKQLADYHAQYVKEAPIHPSPLWLAWMQNTQQAQLKKIMDSLAD